MAKLALENVRVVDLSHVWAGPFATQLLAGYGAEVIRVEACQHLDGTRFLMYAENEPGERPWNRGMFFAKVNRNKYGITLNLNHPKGTAVFKELLKISDVVLENFTPRVMKNFGLDYPVLKEIKPDIIMISMSGYGETGPYRNYAAYGQGIECFAGLAELTGYRDGPPLRTGVSYADPIAGFNGAGAVLAALRYRNQTGHGQHVDLSMRETLTPQIGEYIMGYQMNSRVPPRLGNRHECMVPHGLYPCRGEDEWLAVSVTSEESWRALCRTMRNPALADDPFFADRHSRLLHQDELDATIGEWTRGLDKHEAMRLLQEAGIAAGAVMNNKDLLLNPHMQERGFYEMADHPEMGRRPMPGMPAKLSKTPGSIRRPAPCFGQHNGQILNGLLGMSNDEIETLVQEEVIGEAPIPMPLLPRTTPFEVWERIGVIKKVEQDYLAQLGIEE